MPPTKNYPKITQIHPSKMSSNKKNTQNINWHNWHNPGPTGIPRKNDASDEPIVDPMSPPKDHNLQSMSCDHPSARALDAKAPNCFGALRLPLTRGTLGRVKCVPEFCGKFGGPSKIDFRIVSFGQNLEEKTSPPGCYPDWTFTSMQKNLNNPKALNSWQEWLFTNSNFLDHWGPQYERGKHMGIPGTQMRPLVLNGVLGWLTFKNRGHWGSRYI